MKADGIRRAAAFITSAFGSYSGCRQYREDIARAQSEVEGAPEIDVTALFWNQPGFLEPMKENVRRALDEFEAEPALAFTAHSIPMSMASTSPYVHQLKEACEIIADAVGHPDWELVYQSRSGAPGQPWLEPDILDHIRDLHASGVRDLVIVPVGFISDHMEVLYDLDTEAAQLCAELGIRMVRAGTVGVHPQFVRMIREMINVPRNCAAGCCPKPQRPNVASGRSVAVTVPAES